MTTSDFDELTNLMADDITLKILFYLREFNPNVTIDDLVKTLDSEKKDVEERLDKLEKLGIITKSDSKYRLTSDGKIMVNGFYHNLGEPIPEERS